MNEAKRTQTVPNEKTCPQCGVPLPAGALAGLCPACLLQQGAAADTGTQPGAQAFEPPPVTELAKLFPQLEILALLGKGGMGAVYKARQPALDRFVALKILPPQTSSDAGFAERFSREARALARLSHPNIVAVYDFGQVRSGADASPTPPPSLHYFLMEFVDGVNLRQLEQAGRLSPREALQIIPQICDALQYAHDEGVVHRDIKPENVLVDRKGRVKIADFGLAKILGREPSNLRLTGEGQVMGTPHYMAPEQIEHPLAVDHRADIYSLGVVFYEMLTGELPLGRFAPPSRKVQVDVRLDEVVFHALEKEPERRYQHVSEVKSDVQTITSGQPGAAWVGQTSPVSTVHSKIRSAAFGLQIVALLDLIVLPLAAIAVPWFSGLQAALRLDLLWAVILLNTVVSGFVWYGGWQMKRLRGHRGAQAASILLLLLTAGNWAGLFAGHDGNLLFLTPGTLFGRLLGARLLGPGDLMGIPVAIWAFIVLLRRDVREAFRADRSGNAPAGGGDTLKLPASRLVVVIAVALLLLLTAWGNAVAMLVVAAVALVVGLPVSQARTWRGGLLVALAGLGVAGAVVLAVLALSAKSFSIGQAWFPQGDSIEITSVKRSAGRMVVRGRYDLVSHDRATLALYITSTNKNGPEDPQQRLEVSKGRGDFALTHGHPVPGLPHLSMCADGEPFAALYFGNQEEARREGRLALGHDSASFGRVMERTIEEDINAAFDRLNGLQDMKPGQHYELAVGGRKEIGMPDDFLRRRTGPEILASGWSSGCGDYALAFVHLMERRGYQTLLVDSAEISLSSLESHFAGHVVVAVRDTADAGWALVDPTNKRTLSNNWSVNDKTFYGDRYWIGYCGPPANYPVHGPEELKEFYAKTLSRMPRDFWNHHLFRFNFKVDSSLLANDGSCLNPNIPELARNQEQALARFGMRPEKQIAILLVKGGNDDKSTLTYSGDRGWVCTLGLQSACSLGLVSYMQERAASTMPR